jgi:hypothetical protein
MIISDQRMPSMLGVDVLARCRDIYPIARRVLLTGLSKLGPYDEQLALFERGDALHDSVDAIRARYGYDLLQLALGTSRARRRASEDGIARGGAAQSDAVQSGAVQSGAVQSGAARRGARRRSAKNVEMAQQVPEHDEDDDRAEAAATQLLGPPTCRQPAQ